MIGIEVFNLADLPDPARLERIMQSLAMLDSILEKEWAYRYFSFDAHWSTHEKMGSMRNGQGDDVFAVFDAAGAFVRGFDHESAMSPWRSPQTGVWPGVLEQVPPQFSSSLKEPAFHMEDTSFCLWRPSGANAWQKGDIAYPAGDDPDGAIWMLSFFKDDPAVYQGFARSYYEIDVPLDAIARIYRHEPLSLALVQAFPSQRAFEELAVEAREIAYPVAER